MENDPTGFTFMWAAAGTAQMQTAVGEQLAAQAKVHWAEIQKLAEECHVATSLFALQRFGSAEFFICSARVLT